MRRSTSSHPACCHCQCGDKAGSWGRLSLTRKARRTTNRRSVTSWTGPKVNSLTRASIRSGRTFSETLLASAPTPGSAVQGTVVHFPKVMMCGLGAAIATACKRRSTNAERRQGCNMRTMAEVNQKARSQTRLEVTKSVRSFREGPEVGRLFLSVRLMHNFISSRNTV